MKQYQVTDASGRQHLLEGDKMEIDAERSRTTIYMDGDVVFSGVGVQSAGIYSPMPVEPSPPVSQDDDQDGGAG